MEDSKNIGDHEYIEEQQQQIIQVAAHFAVRDLSDDSCVAGK